MSWKFEGDVGGEWDERSFRTSVELWVKRPNLCNKIVSCSSIVSIDKLMFEDILDSVNEVCRNLKDSLSYSTIIKELEEKANWKILRRKLVPRKSSLFESADEVVISSDHFHLFLPLNSDFTLDNQKLRYAFVLNPDLSKGLEVVSLWVSQPQSNIKNETILKRSCHPTIKWLKSIFLPFLKKSLRDSSGSLFPASNSCINSELYALKYEELKAKYGKKIAESWPEVTDPQKYVMEDVAIASYLLVLWKTERESKNIDKKQSFVDIGCGNGLLTHILTSEGHLGKGLDLRSRGIWSMYGPETKLEEHCVLPDDTTHLEGYDWLLGNHCDELTPWLPVLAAKCSKPTNFWLLPCCFFDFFGKYSRKQSSSGQYFDYINFISSICKTCGYANEVDVMRIPSTKRVCIIGRHEDTNRELLLNQIEDLINSRKSSQHKSNNFVPRPKLEPVNNCTRIDKSLKVQVVQMVTNNLLSQTNYINLKDGVKWNKGGRLELKEVADSFDENMKQKLKKECGGIQTLLRNNHQIFLVQGGYVQIRDWNNMNCQEGNKRKRKRTNNNQQNVHKTKPCWFDCHHPDGCPRSPTTCPFLHKTEE